MSSSVQEAKQWNDQIWFKLRNEKKKEKWYHYNRSHGVSSIELEILDVVELYSDEEVKLNSYAD